MGGWALAPLPGRQDRDTPGPGAVLAWRGVQTPALPHLEADVCWALKGTAVVSGQSPWVIVLGLCRGSGHTHCAGLSFPIWTIGLDALPRSFLVYSSESRALSSHLSICPFIHHPLSTH